MKDEIHEIEHNIDVKEMMDSDDIDSHNIDDTLLGNVGHSSPANLHAHDHKENEYHSTNCKPVERYKRDLRK